MFRLYEAYQQAHDNSSLIHHFTTSPFHYFTTSPLHHFTTSPFPSATIRASIVDKSPFFPQFINNALKCPPVQILLTIKPARNGRLTH
jgi:hypothetical protein